MDWGLGVIFTCLGLVVGSFLNVVICRLPRGKSLVLPRSACPGCGHALGFLDLVPVFSFLLLGARCRYCRQKISWQYPLIEALTGAIFLLLYLRYGLTLQFAGYAVFAAMLVPIAVIDLREMIIPDVLVFPGIGLGLLYGLFNGQGALGRAVLGAAIGAGFILAVYYLAKLILKKEGIGLGDATLLAMLGAFLGWQGAVVSIFLGSLLGTIAGLGMIAARRMRRSEPMPFGPFLAAAGIILAVWPYQLWLGRWLGVN